MISPTYITGTDQRLLQRLIRTYLHGTVLDIGCGDGSAKQYLPPNCTYTSLDSHAGPGVDVVADAHNLPFPDQSFDSVLAATMLEHVKDERKVISEIYRVLKPQGTLIITLPFLLHYHRDPEDYRRLTHAGLQHELEKAGFTSIAMHINYGVFTVIEFALFSALVHAYREKLFSRHWYLLPYYAWIAFWFIFFKGVNYLTAPLQRYDRSLYVGLAATATKE